MERIYFGYLREHTNCTEELLEGNETYGTQLKPECICSYLYPTDPNAYVCLKSFVIIIKLKIISFKRFVFLLI